MRPYLIIARNKNIRYFFSLHSTSPAQAVKRFNAYCDRQPVIYEFEGVEARSITTNVNVVKQIISMEVKG